jgi:hypothetical protein
METTVTNQKYIYKVKSKLKLMRAYCHLVQNLFSYRALYETF